MSHQTRLQNDWLPHILTLQKSLVLKESSDKQMLWILTQVAVMLIAFLRSHF